MTIEFWAMGREGEVVQELMPAFEREHPGVRVEVQQLPWTSAHEKLVTAFAGRATSDRASSSTMKTRSQKAQPQPAR